MYAENEKYTFFENLNYLQLFISELHQTNKTDFVENHFCVKTTFILNFFVFPDYFGKYWDFNFDLSDVSTKSNLSETNFKIKIFSTTLRVYTHKVIYTHHCTIIITFIAPLRI